MPPPPISDHFSGGPRGGTRAAPPPPATLYFYFKLRPDRPKKIWGGTPGVPLLSQSLDVTPLQDKLQGRAWCNETRFHPHSTICLGKRKKIFSGVMQSQWPNQESGGGGCSGVSRRLKCIHHADQRRFK